MKISIAKHGANPFGALQVELNIVFPGVPDTAMQLNAHDPGDRKRVRAVGLGSGYGELGMGLMFTQVDAENRERLLRFFISDRIRDFYSTRFVVEFPHLESTLTLKDVALVINLWEDKEGRLTALHGNRGGGESTRQPVRRSTPTASRPRSTPTATRSRKASTPARKKRR